MAQDEKTQIDAIKKIVDHIDQKNIPIRFDEGSERDMSFTEPLNDYTVIQPHFVLKVYVCNQGNVIHLKTETEEYQIGQNQFPEIEDIIVKLDAVYDRQYEALSEFERSAIKKQNAESLIKTQKKERLLREADWALGFQKFEEILANGENKCLSKKRDRDGWNPKDIVCEVGNASGRVLARLYMNKEMKLKSFILNYPPFRTFSIGDSDRSDALREKAAQIVSGFEPPKKGLFGIFRQRAAQNEQK
jgi:hypothetical protein